MTALRATAPCAKLTTIAEAAGSAQRGSNRGRSSARGSYLQCGPIQGQAAVNISAGSCLLATPPAVPARARRRLQAGHVQ